MQDEIIEFLLTLNRTFYQTFGSHFSETRGRLQPGVLCCLQRVSEKEDILDLGCGNGQLARSLLNSNFQGLYVGIDSSSELISIAVDKVKHPRFHFVAAELSSDRWPATLVSELGNSLPRFDRAFAFALLHHIPGESLREALLRKICSVLRTRSELMISVWDFIASPRMRERILPWEIVGLEADAVDQGDYLIDWRRGGHGQRYVHLFRLEELQELAHSTGFEIMDTFRSDGEGGKLGLYQIWEKS